MWVATTSCNFVFGQLFSYAWLFFAVSLVQNIFMVIVEDSYISIKYAKNFEWLRHMPHGGHLPGDGSGGRGPGDSGSPKPPQAPFFLNNDRKQDKDSDDSSAESEDQTRNKRSMFTGYDAKGHYVYHQNMKQTD